jgi:quinol monooxygenase YgiN
MSVTVIVSLKVRDFDAWKATFDGHASAREAAGINASAYRNLDDEGNAVAIGTAASKEAFIAFFSAPEMKEVQAKAGVLGPPEVTFLEKA